MDYVIFGLVAYLLGSIPSALIVGKVGYNIDIREHGSGNLGATNTFRILGTKAGAIVTLADILKGTLATVLPQLFDANVYVLAIGLLAVVGHMYPIFAKFRGGKAVATSGGMILGMYPLLFVIMVATFLLTLYLSKYVSLSSIITGLVSLLVTIFYQDLGLSIVVFLLSSVVCYRHRENIKRIKNGTEPKISWM
ncbi:MULTISPECIES: glycerol-3-phosphate 1-O-acyltransferase PlsY [Oceanobacillus]|uniref:Glycerol-3-phosphate acyltransferase n=1 Tax=Oceanobacillus kimchii TaxID=746691 RepID=A0ABQ5THJ0_9BACI|nr:MULTISPECIES: glycerol-3-phosphate 1-O-acyltransferase PlsY [Oceanobacillus]MBT2598562.1 glycerol-3-phosphate 1-O-acyltransferase PlsY [Oceanobacillus sp. ISL-74]MBT2651480.1 glycerol-3-phosphate 1-O-acyltransferase PlsY [Oceanobacillus sp. ISL-73]MCT1576138.1 glycerol-3-phosphate 1-O-acyltransferase PlsY [Oceanobacillus kimchii]MCT2135775.1 glycerol-3-phosphate 1-O-acyltransferase PlsY [Oceanobacillus kimchii]OEH55866.1 glycerol-3-phosphate acyltransferase [Oceanobacillus sp. E9]